MWSASEIARAESGDGREGLQPPQGQLRSRELQAKNFLSQNQLEQDEISMIRAVSRERLCCQECVNYT